MAEYNTSADGDLKKPLMPAPDVGPRPYEGKMDDTEFQSIISGLISSAAQYIDGELSPDRAKATDYYFARPFGNEEPGRSQFISTEVRDGVSAVLPGMLKGIFGPEQAVEFVPRYAEDVESAQQATDFIQYVFAEENPGFQNTLAAMKDGLVRATGVAKWWWDDTTEVTTHKFENVSKESLELLAADDEIELTRIDLVPGGELPLFNVELKRTEKDGRARWDVIPPEEFLYNRESRRPEDAIALWHRTRKTRGELIAMGIEPKLIDEHGGDDPAVKDNMEVIARTESQTGQVDEEEAGKANEKHLYCEGFARIDFDGDGVAELRKVCALGPGHYPVVNEPATDGINFAIFVPDPEPHTMTGGSWAVRLMDLQKYKSMLMRGMSDSLALSIFPRMAYKAGDANLADILNTSMGAPLRVQSDPNGALRVIEHNFLGKETLPIIDLVDTINERRTGQNRGVAALDADALQSSTPAAVQAAISASQAQQELLLRIFAETFLKPLFKGLLKLMVTHQPRRRMVRLRNKWTEVDPRDWNADMDARVNVALGSGFIEEKVQTLALIAEKQELIMQQMGPDNPIVSLKEYRDTLAEMVELRGRRDAARYFKPITKEQMDAMAQAKAQQPPEQTPEMVLAQAQMEIERMKAEANIANEERKGQRELAQKQAEMAMKWQELQMEDQRERAKLASEDDRERDKQASDFQLEIQKLELQHMMNINEHKLNADVETTRAMLESGPQDSGATDGLTPAPRRRRRHVTIEREDGRPPLRATIEDHDVADGE